MHDAMELERLASELALTGPIESFLVLADWLQRAGDPWGELIAIQCAPRGVDRDDAAIDAAARRLLAAHGSAICTLHGAPGRIVEWSRGFVTAVTFTDEAPVDLERELEPLLSSPAGRLLARLGFEDAHLGDRDAAILLRLAEQLARVELDLRANWFSHDAVQALRAAFPAALLGSQRRAQADDRDRVLVKSWGGPGGES